MNEGRMKGKAFRGRKRLHMLSIHHQLSIWRYMYKRQQKIGKDGDLQTEEECRKPATSRTPEEEK